VPLTANGPLAVIDPIANDTTFGFVIVTILAADTDPTCTRPNASEVGENVAAARVPVPLSATGWGLPAASSLIFKLPLSAPVWVGLKITATVQLPFGASWLPLHPSLVIENCPDTVTELIKRATVFGFDRVVVDTSLLEPTFTLPIDKVSGLTFIWPATPTPLKGSDPALGCWSSLIASDAVRVPRAPGVKVIVTVQLAPAASVEPHPLLLIANSLALAPRIWKFKPVTDWLLKGSVILRLLAPLVAPVTPNTTLPNEAALGASDNAAAATGWGAAAIVASITMTAKAKAVSLFEAVLR
jgi:hypothetical protein